MGIKLIETKKLIVLIVLIICGAAAGLIMQRAVILFGLHVDNLYATFASFERVKQNFILYLKSLSELFNCNLFFTIDLIPHKSMQDLVNVLNPDVFIIKVFNLFVLIVLIFNIFMIFKKEKNILNKFVCSYMVMLAVLLSMAYIFSTRPTVIRHARYLTPLLYVYAFFLSLSIAGNYRIAIPTIRYLVVTFFLVSSVYNIYTGFQFKQEQKHLQLTKFLENNKFHYGYSSYWHSNIITFLSHNKIKVRPLEYSNGRVDPLHVLSKSDWYEPSAYKGETFLMVPRYSNVKPENGLLELSPVKIKKMFGEPERFLTFENMDIYVWPYNIMEAVKENRTMSVDITDKILHHIGSFVKTKDGNEMHSEKGQSGYLVYGPYWPLKEGNYRVKFIMQAISDTNQEIARIDVNVIDTRTQKTAGHPFEKAVTSTGKAEWKEYSVDFKAGNNKKENLLYEFRVFASGKGDVKVREILIDDLNSETMRGDK